MRLTFFIVGRDAAVPRTPRHLRAAVAAGHELGNHSFEHEPWLDRYTRRSAGLRDRQRRGGDPCSAPDSGTIGFRGPGYSWSPALFEVLVDRGYLYDASTLPTYLGPLARAYYFWTARLTPAQREERATLFGGARDGFVPCARTVVAPVRAHAARDPGHDDPRHQGPVPFELPAVSEPRVGRQRWWPICGPRSGICRLTGTEPSFLLHPLDLLGGDQRPALRFFPGMDLTSARKKEMFARVIRVLRRQFRLVNMSTHARAIAERGARSPGGRSVAAPLPLRFRLPPAPSRRRIPSVNHVRHRRDHQP